MVKVQKEIQKPKGTNAPKEKVSKLENVGCSKNEFGASRSSGQLRFLQSIYSTSLEGKTVAKSFYITFLWIFQVLCVWKKGVSKRENVCFCEPNLLYSSLQLMQIYFHAIYYKSISLFVRSLLVWGDSNWLTFIIFFTKLKL
jgi:hypothetical protein